MGCYRVQIKTEMIGKIPGVMSAAGLPLLRTEEKVNGTYYYYHPARRPDKEYGFWITPARDDGGPRYYMSGLGPSAQHLLKAFEEAGMTLPWSLKPD